MAFRNPRAGHGMTGGPILLMLLCVPLMAPFMPPLYIVDWIRQRFSLAIPAPSDDGAGLVFVIAEIPWVAMLAAFWHWMKWSWWIPAVWLATLGLLILAARYC